MATAKSVWGIDIGQSALKALKLRSSEGQVIIEAFDIVEHAKMLSEPDADRKQLIHDALEQFLSRNSLEGSSVVVGVPGQSSFTRFVKLPPVEPKKIPDIVRFEAEQQIPFPINDVVWRWQTFTDPSSPDVELGIFAMKRSDIDDMLQHFTQIELGVDAVQMAPLALYNFMSFDQPNEGEGATLLADVGADKTDLVVSDGARIWMRTIQIGGNAFTEALVKAFKLNFAKAEKLKRTAASSKYARQVFQAMRPVFADLVQEIQRSIGFYTALHRETRFKRMLGVGNGFRLPGLQKFLEQNLNMPVVRVDSYSKINSTATPNAAVFNENVLSFAVAYGLALQGLEQSVIGTNLLPGEITRHRRWSRKKPFFVAAAAVLLMVVGSKLYRDHSDYSELAVESADLGSARSFLSEYQRKKTEFGGLKGKLNTGQDIIEYLQMLGYRNYWPSLQTLVSRSIDVTMADQGLLNKLSTAKTPAEQKALLEPIISKKRESRKMVFVDKIETQYCDDVTSESFTKSETRTGPNNGRPGAQADEDKKPSEPKRGYKIVITGTSPLDRASLDPLLRAMLRECERLGNETKAPAAAAVTEESAPRGRENKPAAEKVHPFTVVKWDVISYPSAKESSAASVASNVSAKEGEQTVEMPDPLIPTESMANDTMFQVGLLVSIDGNGLPGAAGVVKNTSRASASNMDE